MQSGDVTCQNEILETFGQLFRAEQRLAYRHEHCAEPLTKILDTVEDRLVNGAPLRKSAFSKALFYILKRKHHVATSLYNGDAVIENNLSEHSIKPLVIRRKNWLFLGSKDAGAPMAAIPSLVQTCQHLKIDPDAYLADMLAKLPSCPPENLDALLPDRWQSANM